MMKRVTQSPILILGLGTAVAGLIIGATLLFFSPQQCPAEYTQAQVDASGCAVGANIGSGMAMMAALLILIISAIWAIVAAVRKKK
jgi:hypothetical protein